MSLESGIRIGPYQIVARLGAGGMGEVWRARDERLGRDVAIKVLSPGVASNAARLRRFELEARATSQLNHPNILAIYDIGTHEGAPYVVSELLEGATLRSRIEAARQESRDAGIPFPEALEFACQIARGLCAAHEKGIVHRDIKPENVFLRTDGLVKILDFGLAKLHEESLPSGDTSADTLVQANTEPGAIIGTVRYMSPEQARGLAVDPRTDIFSFGVLLFEMVAGRPPFDGPTNSDLLVAILERAAPPVTRFAASAPGALDRILFRALEKDRTARYPSVREMGEELKALQEQISAEAVLGRSMDSGLSASAGSVAPSQTMAEPEFPSTVSQAGSRDRRIDSLAVLPLDNESQDPNSEYLCDGITESLINALAQLPSLRVVSRSSVFRYKGDARDPVEIGRELRVRAVLSGRVLQIAGALVIKLELVDVEEDSQLWGEQYRREMHDIFALQEEISHEVGEKLRVRLSVEEKRRLSKRYTENTEAYHLYLKGRYSANRRTEEWLRKGIEFYQKAIEIDPAYALAYAGLADAYALMGSSTGGLPPVEVYPKAKAAALRALEFDDTLAEAHSSLGFFRLLYDWDWPASAFEFQRAIELKPNLSAAHDGYGFFCKVVGRFDDAIAACRRACEIDPLSLFHAISLAWAYYFARQYENAIEHARRTLDTDPEFHFAYWTLGVSMAMLGWREESTAAFERGLTLSDGGLTFVSHVGYARARMGDEAKAREMLLQLDERSERQYVPAYYFALVHLGLGERDEAMLWLERAFQERAGFMAFLGIEPLFDELRPEPRFGRLLEKVGLQ